MAFLSSPHNFFKVLCLVIYISLRLYNNTYINIFVIYCEIINKILNYVVDVVVFLVLGRICVFFFLKIHVHSKVGICRNWKCQGLFFRLDFQIKRKKNISEASEKKAINVTLFNMRELIKIKIKLELELERV